VGARILIASGLDTESALELLAILNAAERLDHISPLKSVGLHPLKGDRKGQWAITVNGPWRILLSLQRRRCL